MRVPKETTSHTTIINFIKELNKIKSAYQIHIDSALRAIEQAEKLEAELPKI